MAAQVAALDRTEGDIDALLARIAHIRTWTYVSHRTGVAGRRRALAAAHARGRGPALRRAARAAHRAVRGPRGGRRRAASRPDDAGGRGRGRTAKCCVQGLAVGPPGGLPLRARRRACARRRAASAPPPTARCAPHIGERVRDLRRGAGRGVRAWAPDGQRALARGAPWRGCWPATIRSRRASSRCRRTCSTRRCSERVRRRLAAWLEAELRARLPSLAAEDREDEVSPPLRGPPLRLARGTGHGRAPRGVVPAGRAHPRRPPRAQPSRDQPGPAGHLRAGPATSGSRAPARAVVVGASRRRIRAPPGRRAVRAHRFACAGGVLSSRAATSRPARGR